MKMARAKGEEIASRQITKIWMITFFRNIEHVDDWII